MVQPVQQRPALGIADGEVAAPGAEGQAVHVAQGGARGGPVGEDCSTGQVHQPQRVLLHARRHRQDLHTESTQCQQTASATP